MNGYDDVVMIDDAPLPRSLVSAEKKTKLEGSPKQLPHNNIRLQVPFVVLLFSEEGAKNFNRVDNS
eukprot:scaffold15497_cov117-Cylindrotheca_fusiformis.AAC.3